MADVSEFDERRRLRRLQRNEDLFQALNRRLEQRVQDARDVDPLRDDPDDPIRYLCECGSRACDARFDMEPGEYARVHARRGDFIVIQGHENTRIETVIDELGDVLHVRKLPL